MKPATTPSVARRLVQATDQTMGLYWRKGAFIRALPLSYLGRVPTSVPPKMTSGRSRETSRGIARLAHQGASGATTRAAARCGIVAESRAPRATQT